jgi:predicted 3-demethylubiquinone-9 3-methyltransferase (glyoxalase superfamily)
MQKITTFLWFDHQALEAAKYYCSIFPNSKVTKEWGMGVSFELAGQGFIGLNGGPRFKFTEAISLYVNCKDQKEIDGLWKKLVKGGEEQQCGWLKDKFGLSWQIIPEALPSLVSSRAGMEAMLKMKKIDLKTLEKAAASEKSVASEKSAPAKRAKPAAAKAAKKTKPAKAPKKR